MDRRRPTGLPVARGRVALVVVVVAAVASVLVFVGGVSGEVAGSGGTEEGDMVEELYVNSRLVPCEGAVPQECMQVRRSPDAEWELFYGRIEGFTFEPGYTYRLRVRVTPVEPVAADASSLRYELVAVEERART
jgi:Domain of unknown function (DUF4377)